MNEYRQSAMDLLGITEASGAPKFTLKFPDSVDGLTMKFLYLGLENATLKIMDDIKRRTGSNANPISLQVMEGWQAVSKKLEHKLSMTGEDALKLFLKEALVEFNSDAPFIKQLYTKYKLDHWKKY